MKDVSINGYVRPGFEAVREAFAHNFTERNEPGGACCIYHNGEKVVNAEEASGRRALLVRLKAAAKSEGRDEAADFASRLAVYPKQEEEILYPAATLAGEVLKKPAMDCERCKKKQAA